MKKFLLGLQNRAYALGLVIIFLPIVYLTVGIGLLACTFAWPILALFWPEEVTAPKFKKTEER